MSGQIANRVEALLRILVLFAVALVAGGVLAGMRPAYAAFPGSAGSIAFQTDQGGNFADIYKMNGDGAFPAPLASYPSWGSVGPAWSSDGKKLAFASNRDGDMDIYVMNAGSPESATNKPVKFTRNTVEDAMPDWSPSGKKIVFQGYRSGSQDILLMNADGSNPTKLANNPASDAYPAFSPDGKKVAFTSDRSGGDYDIWRMNADGSNPVNLTSNSPGLDLDPSWQPIP